MNQSEIIKKLRNDNIETKEHLARVYSTLKINFDLIQQQEQIIKKQSAQIAELQQVVNELYYQSAFSENECTVYNENWLKSYTGFYQSKDAQF